MGWCWRKGERLEEREEEEAGEEEKEYNEIQVREFVLGEMS